MKKLIFGFFAMLSMSFVSCGGSESTSATNDSVDSLKDSTTQVEKVDTVVNDTVVADSIL